MSTELEKRFAAIESRIAELEGQVRRLNDRAEIENLMGRHQYFYTAGLGSRIVGELWTRRDDARIEYGASGVYQDLWKVKTFYISERLPGRLSNCAITTQSLEIAGDGNSARGLWMAIGTETDAGDLSPAPPQQDDQRRMLMSSETADGRSYRAEWLWQKYEVTFLREEGRWKIWRFHVSEFFRCPFNRDWVQYATERYENDGVWLESLFQSPEPLPPQSHGENLPSGPSTYHWQYRPDALPELVPEPPEPYYTIVDTD